MEAEEAVVDEIGMKNGIAVNHREGRQIAISLMVQHNDAKAERSQEIIENAKVQSFRPIPKYQSEDS